MRRILLAALALLTACDLCTAAHQIHWQWCQEGNATSCAWIAEHTEPTTGEPLCK